MPTIINLETLELKVDQTALKHFGIKTLMPRQGEIGESGAHQLYNHTNIQCTYLNIPISIGIDISEHIDSGKVYINPFKEVFEKNSQVHYNKGEENIEVISNKLRQMAKNQSDEL